MAALKQRILDFIRDNQPANNTELHETIGVSWKVIRTQIAALRNLGLVHTQTSVGHFLSKEDYSVWLSSRGGREYMSRRGQAGAKRSYEERSKKLTVRKRIQQAVKNYGPLRGAEIADLLSVTYQNIATQICEMAEDGLLSKSGKHGSYMYDSTENSVVEEAPKLKPGEADIFTCCRNSPAMKRVLAFYGRAI